ncbi:hypothetical protein A5641_19840 [Mycobacterium sp. 1554424.7]|nr:hypothetical protein A5641_19840 [Mycobacterium sp. 1554424.7]
MDIVLPCALLELDDSACIVANTMLDSHGSRIANVTVCASIGHFDRDRWRIRDVPRDLLTDAFGESSGQFRRMKLVEVPSLPPPRFQAADVRITGDLVKHH